MAAAVSIVNLTDKTIDSQSRTIAQTIKLTAGFSIVLLAAVSAQSQSAFQDLDFESADPIFVSPGSSGVTMASALPGWTAYIGTTEITTVSDNLLTLGAPSVAIAGPSYLLSDPPGPPQEITSALPIIEGQYMVVLEPGLLNVPGPAMSASISQTGLVPSNTESLEFKAQTHSSFTVSLGGQDLSLIPLGTDANYILYGANIPSQDAGQLEALTITALAAPNTTDAFDSIIFSPSEVPEPSVAALTAIGGLLFGARKWFAKRR